MKLVEFVPPVKHPLWKLCLQMGITDVIVKVNPSLTGLPDPWRYETLKRIVDGLKAEGLTVVGLEGDPFDMSPIKQFGERATGETPVAPAMPTGETPPEMLGRRASRPSGVAEREEALAHYRELLESMAKLGIHLLCYNFMVGPGWSRTGVRSVRGGAKATYFNKAEYEAQFRNSTGPTGILPVGGGTGPTGILPVGGEEGRDGRGTCRSGEERLFLPKPQVWANYEYFIKSVMPTAERVGVRMGLHPDDPCLPELGGYARIFETVADYDRAYAIYPSEANAVTFCQANFKLMITPGRDGQDARRPSDGADGQDARRPSDGADGQDARRPSVGLVEVAKHFGKRIAFIHVRDVEGDKTDFTELFHDQGTTDQFALMRTYRELGLDVPVRGDHVPEMEGDRLLTSDCVPGYFTLGRLFANGYLKALLKGTNN